MVWRYVLSDLVRTASEKCENSLGAVESAQQLTDEERFGLIHSYLTSVSAKIIECAYSDFGPTGFACADYSP